MAHGNHRKASEGVRRSKCEGKVRLREYLEGETKVLISSGFPVLTIVRKLDELARRYREESQGRH